MQKLGNALCREVAVTWRCYGVIGAEPINCALRDFLRGSQVTHLSPLAPIETIDWIAQNQSTERSPMATYVRAPDVPNIYHWCRNCSDYPSNPQGATSERPVGQLCDQCRAKEANGNCNS